MEPVHADLLETLSRDAPSQLNLANPDHLGAVRTAAEALESATSTASQLADADAHVAIDVDLPVSVRVALKLALSRRLLREIERPIHASVVFAVYKENIRILTAREHPAGEDFVRQKLRQLRWLFGPTPRHTWDLTVVDDGCPEQSGALVQAVLDEFASPDEEVQVLFLDNAIRTGLPIARDLTSTNESRKGGAIRYGLWDAVRTSRGPNHVALFTDADLSTHLGQIGLLVSPLMGSGRVAAVGSRREPSSVVVKAGTRNVRGKLFIYLWKRLLPQLGGIIDTQCGFKAFYAAHLATWIENTCDNGFSFDIEFLLQVQVDRPGSISRVPIAWIDSEAASTTTDLEPYLPMLQSVVQLYRRELPWSDRTEPFARLIERLDEDSFRELVLNVPPGIAKREPLAFDDFSGTSAEALARAAGIAE